MKRMLTRTVLCFLASVVLFLSVTVEAGVIYVKPTGSDNNTGLSWDQAKQTVQVGLNTAIANDQVWVAAGTYNERITLTSGVALYGGFVGYEDNLSQRNFVTNITILDGQQGGSVVTSPSGTDNTTSIDGFTIQNGKTSNSGGGISCSYSSPTISNNTISGNSARYGGGIGCYFYSSPTIINNTISGDNATYGGGIYCSDYSSPTIRSNTISGNITSSGGGIYCSSSSPTISNNTISGNSASLNGGGISCSSYSNPSIANNIIAFNDTGIDASSGTPMLHNNCVFNTTYNYSGLSAGPTDIQQDPFFVDLAGGNFHIAGNSPCINSGDNTYVQIGWLDMDGQARIYGSNVDIGADEFDGTNFTPLVIRVSLFGSDSNDGSSWSLAKRTVQAGINATSAFGGQVWVAQGTYNERVTLKPDVGLYGGFFGTELQRDQRDWRHNRTILDGQQGGSVITISPGADNDTRIDGFTIRNGSASSGGGIYCKYSSPTISNNTINSNFASWGGGIYCDNYTSPNIVNNAINGNSASSGGAIYCDYSSTTTISNNTITANSGRGIYCYYSSPTIANNIIAFNSSGIYKSGSGTPVLRNNCVYNPSGYNYAGLSAGPGDINLDPRLEDPEYGQYHLKPDSPCINMGNDTDVQHGQVDMDGQARRYDNSTVDIGADEYDGTVYTFTAPIIRVSPSGNDNNTGEAWALAKQTVQAGIDTAASAGGEVWVAEGTYNERIALRVFAYLYGGFTGTETQRDQRDFKNHATILDGQQGGSVVTATALGHQVSRIDGFTIQNGKTSPYFGGGIYCYYSSLTIINNTISGNNATNYGGGIYCYSSSPTISNNTISGNIASDSGGGIYCISSSPTIRNNTINRNSALGFNGRGGGICCYPYSSPNISNNTISGNSATDGGGGIYCYLSSPTISNNIIAFNSTGIYEYHGNMPILRNNCVYNPSGYNYSGLSAGTGDINLDPLFVDNATGNFHLTANSPCIDQGSDNDTQLGWVDMDNQTRIAGPHVDIGADEYPFTILGDCDRDSHVTDLDLAIVLSSMDLSFSQAGYWGKADLDGDGSISSTDLSFVLDKME